MAHQVSVASALPPGTQYVYLPNRVNATAGQSFTLTDEEFAQLDPALFSRGLLIDGGVNGVFQPSVSSSSTLTSGTLTAGSIAYTMPQTGGGSKEFLLFLNGASTTGATIAFPAAFTNPPAIIGVAAGAETAITTGFTATTTTLTIPALTTQTGWIIVKGF